MQEERFAEDVYIPFISESRNLQEERHAEDVYIPFISESRNMQEERYAEDDYTPFAFESGNSDDESMLYDFTDSVDCDKIRQSIKKETVDSPAPVTESSGDVTKLDDFINSVDCDKIRQSTIKENGDPPAPPSESPGDVTKLDDFTNSSSAAGTSNSFRTYHWTKEYHAVLMQAYTKYKAEFASSPDPARQNVWRKIADEVRQKCSITCSDMQCCDRIERLKITYERNKMKKRRFNRRHAFMREARMAFETTGNLGSAPEKKYFSYVGGPSCSNKFNEAPIKYANRKTRIKQHSLLSAYTIHKGELSQPDVDEEAVWNVIADEVRDRYCLGCDGLMCRNKLEEFRIEYERLKNKENKSRKQLKFMADARKAFETTENPVNSSAAEPIKMFLEVPGNKNRRYLLLLLQLYGKYKTGVASPELEEQGVWERIAAEMKEKFLYDCTDALCRFDVIKLKDDYERVKRNPPKDHSLPYYFSEAQQVFETAGSYNNQVDISSRNASQYCLPHAAVQGNVQVENVVVKVSNLPRQFGQGALRKIFRQCGYFARIHIPRDQYSCCKGFAFIRFRTQNQARRALRHDGYVYNNMRLRVEFADLSEISDFLKS